MTTTQGGCQCGAVRYTLHTGRRVVYACHCTECQTQSASAFGLSMPVKDDEIAIVGALASFSRDTASGGVSVAHFCPRCGVRIYHRSGGAGGRMTLKAGTLDDTGGLKPVAHFWTRSKQAWIALDPEVPQYETQPEDLAGWRAALIGSWDA